MKISKLFHWLYAILMLLPFAFFVPSVLYYAFNDNATMQSVEVPKTETISVDFNQKIKNNTFENTSEWYVSNGDFSVSDNIALVSYSSTWTNSGLTQYFNYDLNHIYYAWCYVSQDSGSTFSIAIGQAYTYTNFSIPSGELTRIRCRWQVTRNTGDNYTSLVIGNRQASSIFYTYQVSSVNLIDLTQMFGSGNEPSVTQFDEWFTNSYYPYTESELMQITYDTGETEQLVENTSIINYAWESIWDLPLFSWTKITFVSVPFSYLTGIFGIGASNSLNYVFGYFVTISIVWLVFDLLLYVPMLAHNWIDKARIE